MNYSKLPLSIPQQIERLQALGMVIPDIESAAHHLGTIGYYRFSVYCMPFELPRVTPSSRNHQLRENTSFDDVLNLYIFDRKLRIQLMEAIERIEVAVRTRWANHLSAVTNDAHIYMKSEVFRDPWEHQKELARVSKDLSDSSEVFVDHYRRNYSLPYLPPIWAMVETLTLGQLSKWVANTSSNHVKKSIATSIGLPTVELFENALQCLALIRNICAHHGRLWDRHQVKRLAYFRKLNKIMVFHNVTKTDKYGETRTQSHLSNNLYNYVVIIFHMMRAIEPRSQWQQRLIELINTTTPELQERMGFPKKWAQQPFFNQ